MNYGIKRLHELKAKYGEPETLEQMFNWLLQALQDQGTKRNQPWVVGMAWSVSYRDRVSNTHYCPADGETNWYCKPELPRGYPGYTGRVWVRISYENERFGSWVSDNFAKCHTYPGTGGAGAYDGPWKALCSTRFARYGHRKGKDFYPDIKCYSWDYRFFHDDFPLIRTLWEKHNLFKVIETQDTKIDIQDYRVWEDPDTAARDKAFMEECKDDHKTY